MTHIFVFVFDLRRIGKSETSSQEKYDSPTHLGLDQPPGDQGGRVLDLAEIFSCYCYCYFYCYFIISLQVKGGRGLSLVKTQKALF